MTDYYQVLGLPRLANAAAVRTAYRAQAMRWHPDRNPSIAAEAHERFVRIVEAYEVLSRPELRAEYDAALEADVTGNSEAFERGVHAAQSRAESWAKDAPGFMKDVADLVDDVFASLTDRGRATSDVEAVSIGRRAAALAADLVAYFGPPFAFLLTIVFHNPPISVETFTVVMWGSLLVSAWAFLARDACERGSVGKRLAGIRAVSEAGTPASFGQSIGRNAVLVGLALAIGWLYWDEIRRGVRHWPLRRVAPFFVVVGLAAGIEATVAALKESRRLGDLLAKTRVEAYAHPANESQLQFDLGVIGAMPLLAIAALLLPPLPGLLAGVVALVLSGIRWRFADSPVRL